MEDAATANVAEVGQVHSEKAGAGEGERCNPSLPPADAISCAEDFYCSASIPGAFGTCEKCTPEKCQQPLMEAAASGAMAAGEVRSEKVLTAAGEGEKCNPSLVPMHAVSCSDGFYCDVARPGADGQCKKCTPERCEQPLRSSSAAASAERYTVGKGERCNEALPKRFTTYCAAGLYCSNKARLRGADGVCVECTNFKCEGSR